MTATLDRLPALALLLVASVFAIGAGVALLHHALTPKDSPDVK